MLKFIGPNIGVVTCEQTLRGKVNNSWSWGSKGHVNSPWSTGIDKQFMVQEVQVNNSWSRGYRSKVYGLEEDCQQFVHGPRGIGQQFMVPGNRSTVNDRTWRRWSTAVLTRCLPRSGGRSAAECR